jgi:hypothetical protein
LRRRKDTVLVGLPETGVDSGCRKLKLRLKKKRPWPAEKESGEGL